MSFFEYDRLVAMYREMFGADNVLAMPLELLRADPAQFSARLFGFLDLPNPEPDTETKTNAGWGALTVELYRLTNGVVRKNPLGGETSRRYRARQFVAWRIDRVIPKAWNKAVERRKRAALAARVGDYYAASNVRLSKMLEIDLAALGYR